MPRPTDEFDLFRGGAPLLRAAVAGMSREQLTARPVPGRWSTLDVLCHLADSEQIWCHRMKRVISEERPLLVGYDESRFHAALGYESRDPGAELALFEATRDQMCLILERIPPVAWGRVGVHTERGLVSLSDMVRIEADHVVHHVRFIEEKRRALGLPAATDEGLPT